MPTRICPTCERPFHYRSIREHPFYPFCSERCRQAELAAWLEGRYVISRPIEEAEAEALEDLDRVGGAAGEEPAEGRREAPPDASEEAEGKGDG